MKPPLSTSRKKFYIPDILKFWKTGWSLPFSLFLSARNSPVVVPLLFYVWLVCSEWACLSCRHSSFSLCFSRLPVVGLDHSSLRPSVFFGFGLYCLVDLGRCSLHHVIAFPSFVCDPSPFFPNTRSPHWNPVDFKQPFRLTNPTDPISFCLVAF